MDSVFRVIEVGRGQSLGRGRVAYWAAEGGSVVIGWREQSGRRASVSFQTEVGAGLWLLGGGMEWLEAEAGQSPSWTAGFEEAYLKLVRERSEALMLRIQEKERKCPGGSLVFGLSRAELVLGGCCADTEGE